MNRREFLVTTAAASAAPLVPTPAAAEAVATPAVPIAAPLVEPPPVWKWYSGPIGADWCSGETYEGPFETREAALAYAIADEHEEIVEAHNTVMACALQVFDGGDLRDRMIEAVDESEEFNPDGSVWETVPQEEFDDLAKRLNAATRAWFIERGIAGKMNVWFFQGVRNRETVPKEASADV